MDIDEEEKKVDKNIYGMYYFLVYSNHFLYSPFFSFHPNIGLYKNDMISLLSKSKSPPKRKKDPHTLISCGTGDSSEVSGISW